MLTFERAAELFRDIVSDFSLGETTWRPSYGKNMFREIEKFKTIKELRDHIKLILDRDLWKDAPVQVAQLRALFSEIDSDAAMLTIEVANFILALVFEHPQSGNDAASEAKRIPVEQQGQNLVIYPNNAELKREVPIGYDRLYLIKRFRKALLQVESKVSTNALDAFETALTATIISPEVIRLREISRDSV